MQTRHQYDLGGLDLLLVEDNPHMRRIIRSILVQLGAQNIQEATDARTALKILQDFAADIIIVSWLMAEVDGPQFVKMIRGGEKEANPYVPIIMLSAFTETHRVTEARDAGVNEFLAKPISPKSLYQRIVSIIEKPRPFVRSKTFFGPCRRRQDVGPPEGCVERREADPTPVSDKADTSEDVARV